MQLMRTNRYRMQFASARRLKSDFGTLKIPLTASPLQLLLTSLVIEPLISTLFTKSGSCTRPYEKKPVKQT